MERYADGDLQNMKALKLEWKFIHENFLLPYQTLSDLCAPKTISNHFRLFKIHEKIAFLAEVGKILHQHLRRKKSMLGEK
jgi:hypothetical protein